ncbi:MAG: carbamoyltransferase HypF [Methanomicrobiales archaeon]|nr:carbamoyltransferase HypF [Methanomicrobiales archaeon]
MVPGRQIVIKGVVQGVGFRPFVYAKAVALGICGTVQNQGSEVEVRAAGERIDEFVHAVSTGPLMAQIDHFEVRNILDPPPWTAFTILPSGKGALSGMIPPDIATCQACIKDVTDPASRYHEYWATSCTDCGPRYSIIESLPYDRERTVMDQFPMCPECGDEYMSPGNRRHHAQTITCPQCGPSLQLLDHQGSPVKGVRSPLLKAADLLNAGAIIAIKGLGGFHLACTGGVAEELRRRLGRSGQPFAVMTRADVLPSLATISSRERAILESQARPIAVLTKRDPTAFLAISSLHTIGCMLPYTPLHHLLLSLHSDGYLIMTSANMPGYPMIIENKEALTKLQAIADFFLVHDRPILNRCDDSVMRDGLILRLSRGMSPKRNAIDLGDAPILAVGPELSANITIYKDGFATTSPHVGNVKNPLTYAYLQETIGRIRDFIGADIKVIAHDAHPGFLSTRYAKTCAEEWGSSLLPVQHHRAHIASVTRDPCIGIAIDGVGYGDDGTIWGGEVFAGRAPDFSRVAHLEMAPMPGGDLATRFPERMLYGILPEPETIDLLLTRGWSEQEAGILARQVTGRTNTPLTSSTGRVLDAAAALLGVCRERTYDGEPAMQLESAAARGTAEEWELTFCEEKGLRVFSTRALFRDLFARWKQLSPGDQRGTCDLAASFQYNLALGISHLAIDAAKERGIPRIALSGGVAYNAQIRRVISETVRRSDLDLILSREYPLGDGCISFGQCVCAGSVRENP